VLLLSDWLVLDGVGCRQLWIRRASLGSALLPIATLSAIAALGYGTRMLAYTHRSLVKSSLNERAR